jgi:phosphoribosylglycinamide formyltransferase-1
MNPRVAVLASGEGTTAEAISKVWTKDPDGPRIELIITANPNAGILKRFAGTDSLVTDDENEMLKKLEDGGYDLIWLAGYMKKVGPKLVERYGWRADFNSPYQASMVNIHPGLLPSTIGHYGIGVQDFVLKNNLPAGHSLHVVSENYDEGPLVSEHMVEVKDDDTAETLMERVKASEKKHLAHDIEAFIKQRRELVDGR